MRPAPFACIAALALGLGAAAANALTFLDTGFGTPNGAPTARGLALGSTGASRESGAGAAVLNPAALGLDGGRLRADLAIGLVQANEDRLVPLFDSFRSFVDETIIALNRNTYGLAQGGLVWNLPSPRPMALGVGVFDRFQFDYDYFEELRDPATANTPSRDQILENRELAVDGRLRSITAGYGAELLHDVRIGLAVHRYTGDLDSVRRIDRFAATETDTVVALSQELDGWGWSVGGHWRAHERVAFGVAFDGETRVDGARSSVRSTSASTVRDTLAAGEARFDYPATLRFGLTYFPRNRLRTILSVEMERRFWETLDDVAVTDVLGRTVPVHDTWDFRVGLEHVFYNGLPVRFGFRYLESYADPESERSIFSLGIGYAVAGFQVDATGLFHRQTSRQEFLFSPVTASAVAGSNADAKVEDSLVQLVFGVSRAF
jgi:hypothetical protein